MNVLKTLGDNERLVAYCLYRLDELGELGIVEGGMYAMTDQGRQDVRELIELGYQPNHEDYVACIEWLTQGCHENDQRGIMQ